MRTSRNNSFSARRDTKRLTATLEVTRSNSPSTFILVLGSKAHAHPFSPFRRRFSAVFHIDVPFRISPLQSCACAVCHAVCGAPLARVQFCVVEWRFFT